MRGTPRSSGVAFVVAVAVLCHGARSAGAQEPPAPYVDPSFTCEVHDYGTEPPSLPAPPDDPLCVRYDKSNITVSTLEVADFLLAEPGRVGLVAGKCAYWQQDTWSVRATPDGPPLLGWEGSYWYDLRSGTGAAALRGLSVAGAPVDFATFIEAIRPIVGDDNADEMLRYTETDGGGGMSFAMPGDASAVCPASAPTPDAGSRPDEPSTDAGTHGAEVSAAERLAATGWVDASARALAGAAAVAAALLGFQLVTATGRARRPRGASDAPGTTVPPDPGGP